jgi:hypothetical protein
LRKHEFRAETPILLSAFTHIEVPADNFDEVTQLLESAGKGNISVFPIEWGEELCKSLPDSFLKDGVPLRK